jgi:hypothetical protein
VPEAEEILALSLIFVVHVAGGLMLVWGMLDASARPAPWRRWRRDDGGGDPPREPPPLSPPSAGKPVPRPLPLAGSAPSGARLRDATPLRDAYPRPARRPSRSPSRSPSRR